MTTVNAIPLTQRLIYPHKVFGRWRKPILSKRRQKRILKLLPELVLGDEHHKPPPLTLQQKELLLALAEKEDRKLQLKREKRLKHLARPRKGVLKEKRRKEQKTKTIAENLKNISKMIEEMKEKKKAEKVQERKGIDIFQWSDEILRLRKERRHRQSYDNIPLTKKVIVPPMLHNSYLLQKFGLQVPALQAQLMKECGLEGTPPFCGRLRLKRELKAQRKLAQAQGQAQTVTAQQNQENSQNPPHKETQPPTNVTTPADTESKASQST